MFSRIPRKANAIIIKYDLELAQQVGRMVFDCRNPSLFPRSDKHAGYKTAPVPLHGLAAPCNPLVLAVSEVKKSSKIRPNQIISNLPAIQSPATQTRGICLLDGWLKARVFCREEIRRSRDEREAQAERRVHSLFIIALSIDNNTTSNHGNERHR